MTETLQYELFDNDITYRINIHIPYGSLKSIINWCSVNCKGDWGYTIISDAGSEPGYYSFQFESERDYITFMIWKR